MNRTRLAMAATMIIATSGLQSGSQARGNPAGPHTVIKTYLASGNPGTNLVLGTNVVSNVKTGCPHSYATCTLAMMAMDQVCEPNGDIPVSIQVTVDGKPVDGGVDMVPIEECLTGTWIGDFSVSAGSHIIQLDTVQNDQAYGTQGQWSVNYAVTVP